MSDQKPPLRSMSSGTAGTMTVTAEAPRPIRARRLAPAASASGRYEPWPRFDSSPHEAAIR